MGWRLPFDIGGTFTDFAVHDSASGRVVVGKSLTTPGTTFLLTTRGFRDVLKIQRQLRDNINDVFVDKHPPLVPPVFSQPPTSRREESQ